MNIREYKVIPRRTKTEGNVKETIRYIVVSSDTGELLDDAQGYGYTTRQKAHRAWVYKSDPSNPLGKAAKEKAKVAKYKPVIEWCIRHPEYVAMLEKKASEITDDTYVNRFSRGYVLRTLREYGLTVEFNYVLLYNQILENVARPR